MKSWSVPRKWKGQTCVILAGGFSLGNVRTGEYFDLTPLAKAEPRPKVIAINDSWRLCPAADVFYFCDAMWWKHQMAANLADVSGVIHFAELALGGFWVTAGPNPPAHPSIRWMRLSGQRGMDSSPDTLRHGSNSGYQAIHLAAHYGAKKIILLGYDMRTSPDGRTHWHDGPREPERVFRQTIANSFLPHFPSLVEPLRGAGIEVVNATPDSGLKVWPYCALEEALLGEKLCAQDNSDRGR